MPPSANRRSGNSRRAQYTTFFGYIAGGIAVLVGLLLLVISIASPGAFAGLRGIVSDLSSPGARAAAGTRIGGAGLVHEISGYFQAASQNARLRRELDVAKVRLVEAQAIAEENRRLKALLGLAETDPRPVAVTTLVGSSASSSRRFATIGAGSAQGVAPGMPVRSPLGLVGRVLETGRYSARVLLVSDGESVVPARRVGDNLAVFAQGRGDGTIQLRLINLGINPIKLGDIFATSGSGGLYRPGIPIARAVRLTRDGAIGRLLSDPAATQYVTVEPQWIAPPQAGDAPVPASSSPAAAP